MLIIESHGNAVPISNKRTCRLLVLVNAEILVTKGNGR